jgi:hypothetical protein
VVTLGFGLGKELPRLPLYTPHLVKQAVPEPLFALFTRPHDGIGDVVFVA